MFRGLLDGVDAVVDDGCCVILDLMVFSSVFRCYLDFLMTNFVFSLFTKSGVFGIE